MSATCKISILNLLNVFQSGFCENSFADAVCPPVMLPAVCKHMKKTFPFAAKEAVSMRLSWLMSQETALHLAKVPKRRRCEFELHP